MYILMEFAPYNLNMKPPFSMKTFTQFSAKELVSMATVCMILAFGCLTYAFTGPRYAWAWFVRTSIFSSAGFYCLGVWRGKFYAKR